MRKGIASGVSNRSNKVQSGNQKERNPNRNVLHHLSNEILCHVFSECLTLQDVSRCDVAISNHTDRSVFLACIGSEGCIWPGDLERTSSTDEISWISHRDIKIRYLKCKKVTNDISGKIAGFGNYLHGLTIGDRYFTDKDMIRITNGCPNLKKLYLVDKINKGMEGTMLTNISIINLAEKCSNLEELDLMHNENITDVSIFKIGEKCPAIKRLHLLNCDNITDASIISLGESHPCLEDLDLSFNPDITDHSMSKLLADVCPTIRKLNLYGSLITDISIKKLGAGCPHLTFLNLCDCSNLTDTSICKVADGCPNLECITIMDCHDVTDIGICELARKCPQLNDVNISQCYQITDVSVCDLIKGCHNLKRLFLANCMNITDRSIRCYNIEKLDLSGIHNITDFTVARLARQCHNLIYLGLIDCRKVTESSLRLLPESCKYDYELFGSYGDWTDNYLDDGFYGDDDDDIDDNDEDDDDDDYDYDYFG
jgi:hypothetical protein